MVIIPGIAGEVPGTHKHVSAVEQSQENEFWQNGGTHSLAPCSGLEARNISENQPNQW